MIGEPLRVLVVSAEPPTRDPRRGNGSTLILHDLLVDRPAGWAVTLAGLTDATVDGVPVEVVGGRGRLATRVGALWAGNGAPLLGRTTVRRLVALAREADVTYLHGPETMGLVRHLAPVGPVVVNPIDLLSFHHDRAAGGATSVRDRWAARVKAARMERREAASALADAVILVNVDEAAEWERRHGGTVVGVPNGVPRGPGAWRGEASDTVLFAGTLDYPPNVESACTLALEVLPELRRAVPAARLELVGRRPHPAVAALAGEHVAVLADVPSMAEHYQAAAVAAFPGSLGSGMRNCVTEALVHGCPVVASPHSARNLPPGPHLTVADDDAMADAIATLLTDRSRLREAAAAAAAFGAAQARPADMAARYAEVIEGAAEAATVRGRRGSVSSTRWRRSDRTTPA